MTLSGSPRDKVVTQPHADTCRHSTNNCTWDMQPSEAGRGHNYISAYTHSYWDEQRGWQPRCPQTTYVAAWLKCKSFHTSILSASASASPQAHK